MKIFIILVGLLFSLSAYSLPNEFTVYSSQISGTKDTNCRILFELYKKQYNAAPIFDIKKGASGMIAMKEMLHDKKFSVFCSGPSESIYNNFVYPGNEIDHALLTMVIVISVGPTTFYTAPDSKYKTIHDLINSKESITIGHNAQGTKSVAQAVFGSKTVIWVPFTNAVDSVSSLLKGGLDLYVDSGSLEELSKAGKIRSLGHINGTSTVGGPDLAKEFPVAAELPAFVAITTSINNDPADIEELNQRLMPLIHSKELAEVIGKIGWAPAGFSVKKSNEMVNTIRRTIERLEHVK